MKMMYNGTPIKSLNIKHFEVSTNDCTMKASDLQAGVTGVARGKKIVGTGKAFSFASYGRFSSNEIIPIPVDVINTILISSASYPIKMKDTIVNLQKNDFSMLQEVAFITINEIDYPIAVQVSNNMITISCSQVTNLEILFGKDEYTL